MTAATEFMTPPLGAGLAEGIAALSGGETVCFTQYTKTVLAQDGFVFWVKSGISKPYAGSLHVATDSEQHEDETLGVNDVVFTTT